MEREEFSEFHDSPYSVFHSHHRKLWWMNTDFEWEAACRGVRYRPTDSLQNQNRFLAASLLFLANRGDGLISHAPHLPQLAEAAKRMEVELIDPTDARNQSNRFFQPWGWTPSAVALTERLKARADHPPLEVVRRVNSKAFSFELEKELGVNLPGSAVVGDFETLAETVARACPSPNQKWVVKSVFGVAARERVLGRGPKLDEKAAKWCRNRFQSGQLLYFQPWLDVRREFGIQFEVMRDGHIALLGISEQQTNGAGTLTGFLVGPRPSIPQRERLIETASFVGKRLRGEGYFGPAGIDALEHADGIHPLLEINARLTFGMVALAMEKNRDIERPTIWNPRACMEK